MLGRLSPVEREITMMNSIVCNRYCENYQNSYRITIVDHYSN